MVMVKLPFTIVAVRLVSKEVKRSNFEQELLVLSPNSVQIGVSEMLKFQKIASVATVALALGVAPMSISAQVAGDPATAADPTRDVTTSAPAGPPAQPDTTAIPSSDPALQPQPQAQTSATAPGDVAAFVEQQFAEADANGDGVLTPEEFQPWMAELKAAESSEAGQSADKQDPQTYASNAFAAADADGDGQVSKVELTQFLGQA